MTTPKFTGRNVPISEIAQATGKTAQLIRVGLQKGVFRLSNGEKPQSEIIEAAKAEGISERTLYNAKKELSLASPC